jgi:hypothetical protein
MPEREAYAGVKLRQAAEPPTVTECRRKGSDGKESGWLLRKARGTAQRWVRDSWWEYRLLESAWPQSAS